MRGNANDFINGYLARVRLGSFVGPRSPQGIEGRMDIELYGHSGRGNDGAMLARFTPALIGCFAAFGSHLAAQPQAAAHEHHAAATPAPSGAALATIAVEGQPLAANIARLSEALDYLGAPLPAELRAELAKAGEARDANRLQELLDPRVLVGVHINPEARVKAARGPGPANLQQAGYTAVIVKIVNESGGTQRLRIGSPQAGPGYAGMTKLAGGRMQQQPLRENQNTERRTGRFFEVEMFNAPPTTAHLGGL